MGDAKGILKGIKGAGDAIRGTVNESVDTAFNDTQGEAKNKAVKEKGQADMQRADATVGGNTPTTTHTTTGGTTTGAGAHSGGVGNMSSSMPQSNVGGESTGTSQRF